MNNSLLPQVTAPHSSIRPLENNTTRTPPEIKKVSNKDYMGHRAACKKNQGQGDDNGNDRTRVTAPYGDCEAVTTSHQPALEFYCRQP